MTGLTRKICGAMIEISFSWEKPSTFIKCIEWEGDHTIHRGRTSNGDIWWEHA